MSAARHGSDSKRGSYSDLFRAAKLNAPARDLMFAKSRRLYAEKFEPAEIHEVFG